MQELPGAPIFGFLKDVDLEHGGEPAVPMDAGLASNLFGSLQGGSNSPSVRVILFSSFAQPLGGPCLNSSRPPPRMPQAIQTALSLTAEPQRRSEVRVDATLVVLLDTFRLRFLFSDFPRAFFWCWPCFVQRIILSAVAADDAATAGQGTF